MSDDLSGDAFDPQVQGDDLTAQFDNNVMDMDIEGTLADAHMPDLRASTDSGDFGTFNTDQGQVAAPVKEEPSTADFTNEAISESAEIDSGLPPQSAEPLEQSQEPRAMEVEQGPGETSQDVDRDDKEAQATPKEEESESSSDPQIEYAEQTHTIVIPSYAAWFSMTKISEIERESVPEYFNSRNRSKTPQVYVKYRNFMINAYRLNPLEYLSVTACRRNLVGDACAIMRLHQFLEKWGLINYQVAVEARPASVSPPFTGHWQVKYDTPRGMFPFQIYKGTEDPNLLPKEDGSVPDASASVEPSAGLRSGSVPGGGAGSRTGSRPGTAAPASGATPAGLPKVGTDAALGQQLADDWSKEDILRLLDSVQKHPNDWNAIASLVGRDKASVVLKFVQQNTEDRFCEELGPLKYNTAHIPFSQAENPVTSVLAFLSGLADPELVSAAIDAIKRVQNERAGTNSDTETKSDPVSASLALAAGRSNVFANMTERQMFAQYTTIVQRQLDIIKLKLSKLDMMEAALDTERREMDRERELLFLDRLTHRRSVDRAEELLSKAADALEAGDHEESKRLIAEARAASTKRSAYGYSAEPDASETVPYSVSMGSAFKTWSA